MGAEMAYDQCDKKFTYMARTKNMKFATITKLIFKKELPDFILSRNITYKYGCNSKKPHIKWV
jgi:hypothetical protein